MIDQVDGASSLISDLSIVKNFAVPKIRLFNGALRFERDMDLIHPMYSKRIK